MVRLIEGRIAVDEDMGWDARHRIRVVSHTLLHSLYMTITPEGADDPCPF